ncbi:MAG: TlpA family protein disulfide reductase [Planctomycetaceae bacterium]|nr:TlpA family protein disulfide reductase [Planctomycetaceae bacterium]
MHQSGAERGLVVLGIHQKEGAEVLRAFVKEQGLLHRILLDDGSAFGAYGVTGIPFNVLLDREGRIVWVFRGFGEGLEDVIQEEVEKVLSGS